MSFVAQSLVPSLVTNARNGNMIAFDRLREYYQLRVVAFCNRLLNNHDDAEQAAQETFLRAWCSLDGYRYHLSFSAWLLKIAKNICFNLLRTQKYHVHRNASSLDDPSLGPVISSTAGDDVAVQMQQIYANQLMELLRSKASTQKVKWDALDWEIFTLRVVHGEENFAQIARMIQKSVDTIKYRYRAHIEPILDSVRREMVVSLLVQERSDHSYRSKVAGWTPLEWQLLELAYQAGNNDFEVIARRCHTQLTGNALKAHYDRFVLPAIHSVESEFSYVD